MGAVLVWVGCMQQPGSRASLLHPAILLAAWVRDAGIVCLSFAVGNLRSEDYSLLIKSQLIGAPIGYWIGEEACCSFSNVIMKSRHSSSSNICCHGMQQ